MRRLSLCVAMLLATASHASAAASFQYFAWDSTTANNYAASAGGVGGTLAFSTAGDDVILRNDIPPTEATFIATYDSVVQAVSINNGTGGSTASATALVTFDAPLPAGSRLIAFDVDAGGPVNERVQFTHTSGNFILIDQLESQLGANSIFPSWSAVTGTLTAQRLNNEEASVFDVSGAQSLTIHYLRDATGGGITGARFSIGVPVPEPTSCTLLAATLLPLLSRRALNQSRK